MTSLATIDEEFGCLIDALRNMDVIPFVNRNIVVEVLIRRFDKHVNKDAMRACQLFAGKSSNSNSNNMWIVDYGCNLIINNYAVMKKRFPYLNPLDDLHNRLFDQLYSFLRKDSEYSSIIAAITKKNVTMNDVRKQWSMRTSNHLELSIVALALLNICPTESSVERSFSAQKNVKGQLRTHLKIENVAHKLYYRFNSRVLRKSEREKVSNTIELSDENEDPSLMSLLIEKYNAHPYTTIANLYSNGLDSDSDEDWQPDDSDSEDDGDNRRAPKRKRRQEEQPDEQTNAPPSASYNATSSSNPVDNTQASSLGTNTVSQVYDTPTFFQVNPLSTQSELPTTSSHSLELSQTPLSGPLTLSGSFSMPSQSPYFERFDSLSDVDQSNAAHSTTTISKKTKRKPSSRLGE